MRMHVISAVFWRNVKQYFSGVLGYVFLIVFVLACAVLAFSRQFFADNLATLDQLSQSFPMLLLFIIPAITMGTWADERRMGTDAILFTLPASDVEIMLGKYLAAAAVYTIALVFSMMQLIALRMIGIPDWGVIATTYLGYWVAGLSLITLGMFASSLTSSSTVAFVLGATFCAIPVLLFGPYFRGMEPLERLGVAWHLKDFTLGLIPLESIIYFVSLAVLMLYLNLIVISRRHWSRGQQISKGGHFLVRAISLAVILVSLNYVVTQVSTSLLARADWTAERLYSLSPATLDTLKTIKQSKQPVTIQAFVSRNVPPRYVNTKKQFTGLLRQYRLYGGNNITVRLVEVDANSPEAQEARQLEIEPRTDRSEIGGRTVEQEVFLGAYVSSSQGDVLIPFVSDDASIEYELTYAIAAASSKDRKLTLGIVDTDTFFAGPEFEGQRLPWAYDTTLKQLKTQYRIKHLGQDDIARYVPDDGDDPKADDDPSGEDAESEAKTPTPPDVLLVPDPSSLTDPATDALVRYIRAGHPVLILADPLPFFWTSRNPIEIGVINAPRMPRIGPTSPYRQVLASAPLPKADQGRCTRLCELLGIQWDNGATAWNLLNPHPKFRGAGFMADEWPEYYGRYEKCFVFVKPHSEHQPFNPENAISKGLKEVLFFYPGTFSPVEGTTTTVTPLIEIERESGVTAWEDLTFTPTQRVARFDPRTGRRIVDEQKARSRITDGDLIVLRPASQATLELDSRTHLIGAHITGLPNRDANAEHSDDDTDSDPDTTGDETTPINVVFISDLDFVSDLYPEQQAEIGQKIDNLALLQNAIDVLAGQAEFVELRNRRATPRTLTRLEEKIAVFREQRARKQEEIEKRIRKQLDEAQAELDKAAEEIGKDESLSFLEKLQLTSQQASQAQRRFDTKKEKLDRELEREIQRLESEEQQQINWLENWLTALSVGLAILPALILGAIVLAVRIHNERSLVTEKRRIRES